MCVPPPSVDEEPTLSEAELKRRERDCLIALSNAWEYYKNNEFESSLRNYRKLVNLGCGEENAKEVYLYFGRAYLEVGKLDSAIWAFKQGLRYLPDDANLLETLAYALGRANNSEEQTYYLVRLVEVDSTRTEAFENLADLLWQQEQYNELIHYLQLWLDVEPNSSRAQTDLIRAYDMAGRDPLDYMEQRCRDNPDKPQWCLDFAGKLIEKGDYIRAYRELEGVIQRSPTTRSAYQLLAEAALDNADIDRAISALERLYQLDRTNGAPTLELTRAYLRKREFPQALEWAETALRVATNEGEALYVRAEVYADAAEECVNNRENGVPIFHDKMVYQMAFEDYKAAVDKGYRRAMTKADFLEKNLIPTKGDWFLQDPNKQIFKPEGACYTWIERTVRRP
ncbi:tetratricopeptide repeat protein [Candidatus Neomarinimicrobiota bacterium]